MEAYQLVTGTVVGETMGCQNPRVPCPSRIHRDEHPSCDLSVVKRAWCCRSCDAGGGLLDLVIAAGHAPDRASAARWYEDRLGLSKPHRSQTRSNDQHRMSTGQLERAVARCLEKVIAQERELLGCRPSVLTRHLAAARRRAGDRFGIKLRSPAPVWYELDPHATDPLWDFFVKRAIEERSWRCGVEIEVMTRFCEQSPALANVVLRDAAKMLRQAAA